LNRIEVQQKVLSENDRLAKSLRERIRENGVYCPNLISSPGAGKTLLLERTLAMFPPDTGVAVLAGDIRPISTLNAWLSMSFRFGRYARAVPATWTRA